jgi:ABC-type lipoprotein release transport system permease subunit
MGGKMKPLSANYYYKNNFKKSFIVFTAVFLCVFLVHTLGTLIDSETQLSYNAFVEPFKNFTTIISKGSPLNNGIVEKLRSNSSVEEILPCIYRNTNFTSALAGNSGVKVFALEEQDIKFILHKMNLKLSEGNLPKPGSNEIVIHKSIGNNKKLKIGDKLGSNVNRTEWLPGEYIVCGFIEGKSIVSFTSLESFIAANNIKNIYDYGILILPKEGKFDDLNSYIKALQLTSVEIRDFSETSSQQFQVENNVNRLLAIISITVLLIVCICMSFLYYIYFTQRLKEFALLNSVGLTHREIILRAFREIGYINFLSFIAGIFLSMIVCSIINRLFFIDVGQPLRVFQLQQAGKVLCIPLFVSLFGTIPVWKVLKRLDPISIIEGVY